MERDGKRPRLDLELNVSRVEPQDGDMMEDLDLRGWLERMKGRCLRAGRLRKRLEKDNERVIRMMSNLEQERILLETQDWWSNGQEGENEDSHLDEGLGARHPINKPTTKPRQLAVTLIHTDTVPSHQEQ